MENFRSKFNFGDILKRNKRNINAGINVNQLIFKIKQEKKREKREDFIKITAGISLVAVFGIIAFL